MKRNGMKLFVGMDVSLAKTAIRASGEHGESVEEAGAATECRADTTGYNNTALADRSCRVKQLD